MADGNLGSSKNPYHLPMLTQQFNRRQRCVSSTTSLIWMFDNGALALYNGEAKGPHYTSLVQPCGSRRSQ